MLRLRVESWPDPFRPTVLRGGAVAQLTALRTMH